MSLSDIFQLPQDWQIGKSHSDSSLCLLRAGLHADVWFCCMDHDESDKAGRIPAHKLILASRSPVFEAMFYGDMAESSSEVHLPHIEKIPFLLFLRFLYSDETDLSEEYAVDVMRIAHQYQVTTCVGLCSEFLRGIVRIDNACYLLETARLSHDTDLVRAAADFIDDNAPAVIESEGFRDISQETLEYILKGDTFFAPEIDIIQAVDKWALQHLVKNDMNTDSTKKRSAMGNVFYFLRFPTLSLGDFIAAQLTYEYLTNEEQKNTSRYILQKDAIDLCNSVEERRPRKATSFMSEWNCSRKEVIIDGTVESKATLTCAKDIELEAIILLLKRDPCLNVTAKCIIQACDEAKVIWNNICCLKSNVLILPTLQLQAVESPYVLTVNVAVNSNAKGNFATIGQLALHESIVASTPLPVLSAGFNFAASSSPNLFGVSGAVRGKAPEGILAQAFHNRSVSTQTEGGNVSGQILKMSTWPVNLNKSGSQTSFIHGIRYRNKSER